MFCAICDQDERATSAIAVCQRCGVGVCRAHLHTLAHAGAPGGMLGLSPQKRECVCHLCLRDMAQRPSGQRVHSAPDAALPDAEVLIQTVEALLNKKIPMLRSRPQRRWQRLWQSFASRFRRRSTSGARPGTPARG
jgi:hypothetical protein